MVKQTFYGEINGQKFDNVEDFKKVYKSLILDSDSEIKADDDYFTTKIIIPESAAVANVKAYGEASEKVTKLLETDFDDDNIVEKLEKMNTSELNKLKTMIYDNLEKLDDFDYAIYQLSQLVTDVVAKQEEFVKYVEDEIGHRVDKL